MKKMLLAVAFLGLVAAQTYAVNYYASGKSPSLCYVGGGYYLEAHQSRDGKLLLYRFFKKEEGGVILKDGISNTWKKAGGDERFMSPSICSFKDENDNYYCIAIYAQRKASKASFTINAELWSITPSGDPSKPPTIAKIAEHSDITNGEIETDFPIEFYLCSVFSDGQIKDGKGSFGITYQYHQVLYHTRVAYRTGYCFNINDKTISLSPYNSHVYADEKNPSVCSLHNGLGDFLVAYYNRETEDLSFRIINEKGEVVTEFGSIKTYNETPCLVPLDTPEHNLFMVITSSSNDVLIYHIFEYENGNLKLLTSGFPESVDSVIPGKFTFPSAVTYDGWHCSIVYGDGSNSLYNVVFNAEPKEIELKVKNYSEMCEFLFQLQTNELYTVDKAKSPGSPGEWHKYGVPITYSDGDKTATLGNGDSGRNTFMAIVLPPQGLLPLGQFEFQFKKGGNGWEGDLQELEAGISTQDLMDYMVLVPETTANGQIITGASLVINESFYP